MKFYAVRRGLYGKAVYRQWGKCELSVKGFKGAKFKGFDTEKEAWDWVNEEEKIITSYPEGHHIVLLKIIFININLFGVILKN